MSQKPSIPQGTRDFTPVQSARRKYIFQTIESVFQQYGFKQIETPAMENLSTLLGKYGDEGDKLLFRILNSGDFLSKAKPEALESPSAENLVSDISSRGLRYDLTVPFARFVVMHQNEINFPFKRYQIQPVWRADRPQKGRYREFYQCDADVVGSDSLLFEAELTSIYDKVFAQLNIPVQIRINNRKILEGLAIASGFGDQFRSFTVAIDKLDKIGEEKLKEELNALGGNADVALELLQALELNAATIDKLSEALDSEIGQAGIQELKELNAYLEIQHIDNELILDTSLARGLSYYTGTIFEVLAKGVKMGSIGGGGRYADLTGIFGMKDMSGVGISFGADRIYDVLEELELFPEDRMNQTQLLFCCMDEASRLYAYSAAEQCRAAGIRVEVYPDLSKMKKQLGYANNEGIPFAAIIGERERESGNLALKDLENGIQTQLTTAAIIEHIQHGRA